MKHFTTITFGVSFALAAMSYAAPDDPKPAPKAAPKLADQSGDLSGIYACSGTEASGKKYNGVTIIEREAELQARRRGSKGSDSSVSK